MSWKATEISCGACGKPLRDGRVILAVEGDVLGSRIVIACPNCHIPNRLVLSVAVKRRDEVK